MKMLFAGLGAMGGPMAGHLITAGHTVVGYNRSFGRAQTWSEKYAAPVFEAFEDAVLGVDVLALCVGNDDDVRNLVLRALEIMPAGSLIIDHTTTSAHLAREMASAAAGKGIDFVDAPVSGGQTGAENGQLSVMAGGTEAAYARASEVFKSYARAMIRIGDAGAGQTAKMANQIALAGTVAAVAEALHFTKSAGLDDGLVFEAISKGAAGSWQMENRWKTMSAGEYDFGFAVEWIRKDLGIALDESRRNGANLPMTALIDQFYSEVTAMGGRRWDTSSLHSRLEDLRRRQMVRT
ncbi:NAD(P)-dependent oxidoreductase [Asticcacaulis endophyticus]|nr:NAD(P)-dependent oxidoreductase [Asticcacaulis endophyticus]